MYERAPQNVMVSVPVCMNVRHKMLQVYTHFDQFRPLCCAYPMYNLLILIVIIVRVLPLQLLKDSFCVSQDCRMVKGT